MAFVAKRRQLIDYKLPHSLCIPIPQLQTLESLLFLKGNTKNPNITVNLRTLNLRGGPKTVKTLPKLKVLFWLLRETTEGILCSSFHAAAGVHLLDAALTLTEFRSILHHFPEKTLPQDSKTSLHIPVKPPSKPNPNHPKNPRPSNP